MLKIIGRFLRLAPPEKIDPKVETLKEDALQVDWGRQRLENQTFWARAAILLQYSNQD